jgi:holo-[acyl-carrier protein] synthase
VIVGLGVDLCDVERIRRALDGPTGARFRERVFTPAEQEYCEARQRGRFASYAARFAAKEAAMKALGTGWSGGVAWRDFEVLPAADGPPRLVLHGEAAKVAARRGVTRFLVALSHTDAGAVASVIAEGARIRAGHAAASARVRGAGAGSRARRPRGRR